VVSGFHPIFTDERAGGGGDDRRAARALLNDLELADPKPRPWGVLSSAVVAFVSLGAIPVLLWHDRFRDFVDEERRHLRKFAEWLRLHSSRPETMDLRVAGDDLGARPVLSALSVLSVVALVILFGTELTPLRPGEWVGQEVLEHTYRFENVAAWDAPLSKSQRLYGAWCVGLTVAYLFHWVQVQAHASDVRRFVRYANGIFRAADVPRVAAPRVGMGLAPLWLVAGAILASRGAWWGIALAVTGAAQHRYMAGQSPRLRRALAARVREMTNLPAAEDARATETRRRCPHVRCLAPMPSGARFCPRCGHNVRTTTTTTTPMVATDAG
jgi:hypothetical protein